ncbi:Organic solute transporter Ostalpha, putative [Leishmania donovani]|uniref:Organic solute transporter Ostalpha, putative n=1 Tax=Leishmania donovani TaxID=5661 RepID=A0A3S7WRT4_LEIDO|nr:Organic solute transporter Ostalpha, putative [Leishmania donovani]
MAKVQVEFLAQRLMLTLAEENKTSERTFSRGVDLTWVHHKALIYAAVICAVICCFVSFSDLREHLSRFDYPKLQVLEMRIIMMIPIYAFFSALSLLFHKWRFFFETVRDTYESFVLYIFFMLMVSYCGGEGQLLRSLKRKRYKGMHPFPMCYLPSFPLDTDFYLRCKRWVLQCALMKPLVSFIAMICHPLGIYKEGSFRLNNVYTYTSIVMNISLTMALYYLVLFEIECKKEMYYAKTFLKFLCIKSIIFFSYWQTVFVNLASSAGVIYLGAHEEEIEATGAVIQDLLMCFELLPVAFLHRAAFGRRKLDDEMACVPVYMKDNNTGDLRSNVDTALNVNDIIDDTFGTIFFRKGKLIDQENGGESDDEEITYGEGAGKADDSGEGASRGPSAGAGFNSADGRLAFMGNADALARDPTLEELVRHAIVTDYGIRVDGVLHYDADSDREERNQDMNFADTDVILRRSKHEVAAQDVRVDTDLLRSHQVPQGGATPQIYCVVCGRFDRDMVRRRNGYKCKECVGSKSQSLLRRRQQEVMEDDAVGPGHTDVVVAAMNATTNASSDVVDNQWQFSPAVASTMSHHGAAVVSDDDEDALYVQPMPTEADADLVGVTRLPQDTTVSALPGATALVEGFASLQQVLRVTFHGDDTKPTAFRTSAAPPSQGGALPAAASKGPPAAVTAPSPAGPDNFNGD